MARLVQATVIMLFCILSLLAWHDGTRGAQAAEACPAAPGAYSTFAAAVQALNKQATTPSGPAKPGWVSGTVWAALNGKQQQEVLQELIKELNGERVKIATSRAAKEAQDKLNELNRKILVRDRLERDAIIQSERDYDRSAGGKAVPYTRNPRSLSEISDEETAKAMADKPGDAAELGVKY